MAAKNRRLPAGEIIKNEIQRNGLRSVRIMDRAEIDIARWLKTIPWYSRESGEPVQSRAWQDERLGLWYLDLMWFAREMIEIKNGQGQAQPVLLWWMGWDVKRIRAAIDPACEAFLGYADRIPEVVYLGKKNNAPDRYVAWDVYDVQIGELGWIPERFIVLA